MVEIPVSFSIWFPGADSAFWYLWMMAGVIAMMFASYNQIAEGSRYLRRQAKGSAVCIPASLVLCVILMPYAWLLIIRGWFSK